MDDLPLTRPALESAGTEILPGRGLSFLDPFGNHVQIVAYGDVQFSKEGRIQRGMGLEHLGKSEQAIAELREAGLAD